MSGTVFISHSTRDVPEVEYVRQLVEAQGLRVYLAEHDPRPGEHLPEKVRAHILASDAVLVLLTQASIDSRYVHQEIGAAMAAEKLIVPLLHPALTKENLAMLNGAEFLLFDPDNLAVGTPDLVGQLNRIAGRAAVRNAMQAVVVAALVVGILYVVSQDGGGLGG